MPIDELLTDRVRKLNRVLRDVRVQVDVPFTLPLADADYTLVDQVVTNLLENAARHAPEGTTVRVRARERDGWIEVAVADEGPGIAVADRERIFEPFRAARARCRAAWGWRSARPSSKRTAARSAFARRTAPTETAPRSSSRCRLGTEPARS